MTVQKYRHVAIAINWKFIHESSAEADEGDEDEKDDDVHNLMAVHSTKLANACYARMGGLFKGLTPESINMYRTVLDKWQKWYKLESWQNTSTKIKAANIEPDSDKVAVADRMTKALQTMYGANAKFKIEEPQSAVLSTAMGINQLFIILPTG